MRASRKHRKIVSSAVVIVTVLAGCDGVPDNSISAEDLARLATVEENSTSSAPADPLADAQMRMRAAMASSQGVNPSQTWLRKMIEHSRGSVALSEAVLTQGASLQIREKARQTIEAERGEQRELERMLQDQIFEGLDSSNPFARAETRMSERMIAAAGQTSDETWIRMMVEHHRGAIELANILISRGGHPAVIAMARRSVERENRMIQELEHMLRSGPADAGAAIGATPTGRAAEKRSEREHAERVAGRSKLKPANSAQVRRKGMINLPSRAD